MASEKASETGAELENIHDWPKKDKRRFLHAVYRVGDLDRSIKFYTECFGMKLLRKRDVPEEKYSNAFLGFGPEDSHFAVELTYNYGVDKYDIGTGFGHFAIASEDIYKLVENIKSKGGKVTREPGPVKGGSTVIAFVQDPDGYIFELIQRGPTPEPLCQVMLRVGDLDRSIQFYEKVKLEQGLEMLTILKKYDSAMSILDDFGFYEDRQKAMQERKARQLQGQRQFPDGGSQIPGSASTELISQLSKTFNQAVRIEKAQVESAKSDTKNAAAATAESEDQKL